MALKSSDDILQRYIVSTVPSGGRVLELGCGAGSLASPLLPLGFAVYASDRCSATLERVLRLHRELRGRLLQLKLPDDFPFEDGSFDCVVAGALLHHLPYQAILSTMKECRRVLAPGGHFLFTVSKREDTGAAGAMDPGGRAIKEWSRHDWECLVEEPGRFVLCDRSPKQIVAADGLVWEILLAKR